MKNLKYNSIIILLLLGILWSCNKKEFLAGKPDQSLIVPENLTDLQSLLDNDAVMNGAAFNGVVPGLGEVGADDYYLSDDDYITNLNQTERNAYTWAQQIFHGDQVFDWSYPYRCVFYSNVVLEGIAKINPADKEYNTRNNIKGSALFYRAHAFGGQHLANLGRTGEREFAYPGVSSEHITDGTRCAGYNIENSGRQSRLIAKPGQCESG